MVGDQEGYQATQIPSFPTNGQARLFYSNGRRVNHVASRKEEALYGDY